MVGTKILLDIVRVRKVRHIYACPEDKDLLLLLAPSIRLDDLRSDKTISPKSA